MYLRAPRHFALQARTFQPSAFQAAAWSRRAPGDNLMADVAGICCCQSLERRCEEALGHFVRESACKLLIQLPCKAGVAGDQRRRCDDTFRKSIHQNQQEMMSMLQSVVSAYKCITSPACYFVPPQLYSNHSGGPPSMARACCSPMINDLGRASHAGTPTSSPSSSSAP